MTFFSLQIFTKNLNFDSHGQHLVLLLSGRRNVWKVSTKSVRQKFLNSQVLYVSVQVCENRDFNFSSVFHISLLQQELALSFRVSRAQTRWEGKAYLPWNYFPPNVTKFNSYAIHGSKEKRSYEALYPVPQHELQEGQKPDL